MRSPAAPVPENSPATQTNAQFSAPANPPQTTKCQKSPKETGNELRPTPGDLIKFAHAEPRGETKNSDCPDPGDGRRGRARRSHSFRAAPGRGRPRQQNKSAERRLLESRLLREPQ